MTTEVARSRSPPGSWRVLVAALCGWAMAAVLVAVPGAGRTALLVLLITVGALGASLGAWAIARRLVRDRAVHGAVHGGLRLCAQLLIATLSVLVLLAARVDAGQHTRDNPMLVQAATAREQVILDVTLTGFPKRVGGKESTRAYVRGVVEAHGSNVPVLLWLDAGDDFAGIAQVTGWPGQRVTIAGVPERLAPGDTAAFAVRVVSNEPRETDDALAGAWSRAGEVAALMRSALLERAAAVPGAELVPGFAVGDTSLVSEALDEAMLASSLSHLTAVSGANCALVTGAVLWVLARAGAGRRSRLVVAAMCLGGFVLVVGPDASVQRAAVMAVVVLLSQFGGKRATALPSLGIAMLALLVSDPWHALQPGFALSVAATGGIVLIATPLRGWLHHRARIPRVLALPIAVALAAQLACGPLLLFLQPGIPALGVAANVIAAPAAPAGTGIGLIAMLLGTVCPAIANLAVVVASLPARWVAATAEVVAAMPAGRWSWPEGWGGAVLLLGCEAMLLLAWALRHGLLAIPGIGRAPHRRPWEWARPAPQGVQLAVATLTAVSLGTIVAVTLVTPVVSKLGSAPGWAIVACDVGQGDAILIRDPAEPSSVLLVDTGDEPELLLACLDRFGVRRISLLVLSHDDRDHVGALGAITDRVHEAIIAPNVRGEEESDRDVVRVLREAGLDYRIGVAGDHGTISTRATQGEKAVGLARSSSNAGVHWQILAPDASTRPADTNAASLVMRVVAGDTSVLLLGDTGHDEQARLLARGLLGEARVLKVAHHGSSDQHGALPGLVRSEWALVSVGAGNGYGHPNDATLATIARAGTSSLRTDAHGSVALVPRADGTLEAWVER